MAVVPANKTSIENAAALLRAGELVAFPTETVYGLGADATNGEAVARIFAAKGRPRFNPLIVHVASIAEAQNLAEFSPLALLLAEKFWPGPLTIVLKRRPNCNLSELVTAGLETVAVRMPAHPIATALIATTGRPLAAPSANRSGHVSPTRASHVADDLRDKVTMILDAGETQHGLESTVVTFDRDQILLLRPGSITADELSDATGAAVERTLKASTTPISPGQLASHYAPTARVRLDVTHPVPGDALLAFGPHVPDHTGPMLNLSETGDLIEAAARLFWALRTLDLSGAATIAVMPIPHDGIGEAINDRLNRAAAPRP